MKTNPQRHGLAFDPGTKCLGVAEFQGKECIRVALVREGSLVSLTNAIERTEITGGWDWVCVEAQQIYKGSRVNPAPLLDLAYVRGVIRGVFEAKAYHFPLPREWKGNIPKEVFTERILSKLSTKERALIDNLDCPKSLLHNVVDAVGLGAFVVGRL